jgi:ERCC4-type nuclease
MITSILIDNREPQEIQDLKFADAPTVVTQLQAGDAVLNTKSGHILAIERKTPSDLLGSIQDRRLFHQCAAMREISDWRYLVIVGRLDVVQENQTRTDGYRVTNWNWDSVQGALLSVQESGVGVVQTLDYKEALIRLSKRNRDDVKIMPRPDAAFLAGLPGIRATRAMDLLAKCGNAASALDWLSNIHDDYEIKIKGIGPNQKEAIHSLFGLGDKEYLTINLWEDEK